MPDYSNPAIATYLNIDSPRSGCLNGSKVAVINQQGIWIINQIDGSKSLIPNSYLNALDIAPISSDVYILATPTGLVKFNIVDGQYQSVVSGTSNSKSRVKVLDTFIFHQLGNTVLIYDLTLKLIAKQLFGVTEVMDFEYSQGYLYVSGYQQQKRNNIPVQIAFLYRMGFDGTKIYALPNTPGNNQGKLWGYNSADLANDMADTRLNRLKIVGNKLYCLGSAYGGNSIYRWNGKDLSTSTLITTDTYTNAAQTRDETKVYIGVVNLTTFLVERGQLNFPRKPAAAGMGDGNNNFPKTIYSDGTDIFVGSTAAYAIANRDQQTFLGSVIAPYRGDAALLVVSDSLTTRKSWTTPGNAEALVFNDKIALFKTGSVNDIKTNVGTAQSLSSNTLLAVW